jgi:2Fe-2S ferredoxin
MAKLFVTRRDGSKVELDEKPDGRPIMEILRDHDLDVEAICGGCCSCATCHVFIDEPWLAKIKPRAEDESELVQSTEHYDERKSRLSCQVPFTPDLDGISLTVAPEE